MTAGIDFATINSAALRNGRSLVQDLIPGGKFRSLEYVVKNPAAKTSGRDLLRSTIATASGKTLRRTTAARISFRWSLM
jgi:hypothetical protein